MRSPSALLALSFSLGFWESKALPVEQQHPSSGAVELHASKVAEATSSATSAWSTASSNTNANTSLKVDEASKTVSSVTPTDAQGRAILAQPPPDGHTAQVSPHNPQSDREWYPEGRTYKVQDGEITEAPDHAPTKKDEPAAEKSSAPEPPPRRSAFVVACLALLGALAFGALPPPLFAFL